VQRFTELMVWQRGHALTLELYKLTEGFPRPEQFGLVSQLKRAASSVPTNIAEGSKRISNIEFARFLNMAEGSLAETEYLLMLSRDLGYLPGKRCQRVFEEITEIAKMLNGLRCKVENA
jgi:four helix bundle protein